MTIDNVVEQQLQRFQNNLSGQKTTEIGFEQIKYDAVDNCLEHLSLKHEALRHDTQFLNRLGQPLSITFLPQYLNDARHAIQLDTTSLEKRSEKTRTIA